MAIPFKTKHFLFDRQVELEKQVAESALFKKVDALGGRDALVEHRRQRYAGGLPVPHGALPWLDEAILRIKTVARLACPTEVVLQAVQADQRGCKAYFEDKSLRFELASSLVRNGGGPTLVFHLARATFHALHQQPAYLWWLLDRSAPFELEDRLKVMDIIRLQTYAADCFALVCCGDVECAVREAFVANAELVPAPEGIDAHLWAEALVQSGKLSASDLLDHGGVCYPWLPVRVLLLEGYPASAGFKVCVGETGGTPQPEFERHILELDRRAHPPLETLSEMQLHFVQLASLLGAHFALEASGPVTGTRLLAFCEHFDFEPHRFLEIADQLHWMPNEGGNTAELLESVLTGPKAALAPIHAVRIMERALLVTARETDGELSGPADAALTKLAQWCRLDKSEAVAIYESLMESIGAKRKEET